MRRVWQIVFISTLALFLTACFDLIAQSKHIQVEKNSVENPIVLGPTSEQSDGVVIYTIVTQPSHGALDGEAPLLTYTPDTDYVGKDKFTFKLGDGEKESNIATISINIVDTEVEEENNNTSM